MPGVWEFPGGKCEPGETPEAAVARECREETGLAVVVKNLRSSREHEYPHGRIELHYYDCETADPFAEPDPENGFVWQDATRLVTLSFPHANEPILRDLAEGR